MSEKPDPRVRIVGSATNCGCIDPETGDACGHCQRENAAALAALESAGWRIVKLEEAGWWSNSDDGANRVTIYTVIEEGPA